VFDALHAVFPLVRYGLGCYKLSDFGWRKNRRRLGISEQTICPCKIEYDERGTCNAASPVESGLVCGGTRWFWIPTCGACLLVCECLISKNSYELQKEKRLVELRAHNLLYREEKENECVVLITSKDLSSAWRCEHEQISTKTVKLYQANLTMSFLLTPSLSPCFILIVSPE
jgi:hypothetical protein